MSAFRAFISYRREDTSGHAGRLYDALAERFGEERGVIEGDVVAMLNDLVTKRVVER